uniref:Superfamily I DNA and RNA helicase and helicaseubunit n=1 Tax=Ignisphaera aggregans TaxID=334771 RepID=A0A7J2U5P5_9CREN
MLNMCSGADIELPGEVLRHVEIAEKFLAEGRELIDKDPVQASEKLYKAAEEAVKALAIALNLPEARKAIESGSWWSKLLEKAAQSVAKALGAKEFILWWDAAFKLHVDGFHEARLSSEDVKERYEYIESMVNTAKRILQKQQSPRKQH